VQTVRVTSLTPAFRVRAWRQFCRSFLKDLCLRISYKMDDKQSPQAGKITETCGASVPVMSRTTSPKRTNPAPLKDVVIPHDG
jgi:hypothetical protein